MENGLLGSLSITALFIPLVFALYLYISRLKLAYVNKFVLNFGAGIFSCVSFFIYLILYFLLINSDKQVNLSFSFIDLNKFSFDFGMYLDEFNIIFLLFSTLFAVFVSFYSKFYFDKKKQFMFTKQRYNAFLMLALFLLNLFLVSINLIQSIVLCLFLSGIVFVFSYFDIFKNPANHNILRFYRIDLIANFSLLMASLILFKYSVLSHGYIDSTSLDYSELNILISYMNGIAASFEFKTMAACFAIAILAKFAIFPFSCYWGFFANSSNLLYLSVFSLTNNVIALYLFSKISPVFALINGFEYIILSIALFGLFFSLFQILFERNIKIIFGYLNSIVNSCFIFLVLIYKIGAIEYYYFAFQFAFIVILSIFFILDRTNFKKRIINKQTGFMLERAHIVLFEEAPVRVNKILNFIDEKIVQNVVAVLFSIFDYLSSFLVVKTIRKNEIKCVKYILIIFAFFALVAVFIALFARYKC